tara:strand:- start:2077 stop:2751 length:675 start_codon:yes stop_codon:yes gene_type:complete
MIHPRNKDTNRYPLFNELIPEYTLDNTLLDYGGSSGNLIYFSDGAINKSKYTCVDVVKDAIDTGQLEFPDSNFIHWNRYNEMYNTNGIKKEPLPILSNHDYIWGYSVFSHMILEDIIEVILWMKSLNPKKIVMSYLNNDHDDNSNRVMNYFYQKRIKEFNSCVDFRLNKNSFFYLSDNEYGNKDSELFISVYNTKWLSEQLEKYNIKIKKIHASNFSIPFLEIS